MKLSNLSKNKCPSCDRSFVKTMRSFEGMLICLCGWKITIERYKKLAEEKIKKNIKLPHESD
jgi:ribosomal protein L37AE/L43A